MSKNKTIPSVKGTKQTLVANITMSMLLLSVGALCLAPQTEPVTAVTGDNTIYRSAGEKGKGVSLMINVYWGTEEVYEMLDILDGHKGKATFFIGGSWADDNTACLKAIYERGHEIGNHGYFHKDHAKLSREQNEQEITRCNRFIELAIGKLPTLFAPPAGAYGETMLSVCQALQMKTVLWSKDTIDWRDKDSTLIYTRATKNVKKGDFVLMHPAKDTVAVLDDILNYYERNGLEAVTVSDNLEELL